MSDYIRMFGKTIYRDSRLFKILKALSSAAPIINPVIISRRFEINKVTVKINGLPEGLKGFKVLHLSDIHASRYITADFISKMVEKANTLDPDLVVITGDFTDTEPEDIEWSAKILAKLNNRVGIYGVSGNHDVWCDQDILAEKLLENNIKLLRNENTTIDYNGETLILAGIDDYRFGEFNIDKAFQGIDPSKPVIFLSHNPDVIEILDEYKVDLMLSGHIHGGQWRLPIVKALYIPSTFGRKHAWGLTKSQNTYIYTNNGIGATAIPFRFLCPPEITLIELHP